MARTRIKTGESLWYKDAIIYELHVKSFYDGNGDGIGDFQGLIQKLDYLQELGITAIWLLPFYPSPLKDDGYDIADYFNINPDFGSLRDFRWFLRAAHKRGIRVITELVINHTSDQHKWFQRARRAKPGSVWRNFYIWNDTPDKYKEARIIFQDFEHSNWSWDSVAQAYYWHRFYSHQPDLNFDSPAVRREIFRAVDFWFNMGVDGLRLDAVPYLFERDGTNCENLPETHAFLRQLRAHVEEKYDDRMLLAEANQWPEDASEYFGAGDECHMAFHFPVMPRLFMAVQMEDRFPIIDMIEQSLDIPEVCQWAMFLRNHDELTLEMVTDEERDYMYRAFAQDPKARINLGIRRRLAPLLDNNRRKIELMNFLLLSLPGTPVLYYGDEIGMGDNYYLGDRDGVRTPMQWSADRNAGFSRANPQQLYLPLVIDLQYHYMAVNVENQLNNPSSLLWFIRRLAATRNRFRAFGKGSIEFINSDNPRVLTFVRSYEDEAVLVVANLSRFCQIARLDLAKYADLVPEELFGGNIFPMVNKQPYALTLGPHNTYWFTLREQKQPTVEVTEQIPRLKLDTEWRKITQGDYKEQLATLLPDYLKKCRWFGGKGKPIRRATIIDSLPLRGEAITSEENISHLLLVQVSYTGAARETYLLPISFATHGEALEISRQSPQSVMGELQLKDEEGIIYEGVYSAQFRKDLLRIVAGKQAIKGGRGRLIGSRSSKFRKLLGGKKLPLDSKLLIAEQSNTSVLYEDLLFLKLYRRLEVGANPDVEISRHLTEYTDFTNFPAYAGSIEWRRRDSESFVVGLLLEYVPNETDAWTYTLDSVGRYLTQAAMHKKDLENVLKALKSFRDIDVENIDERLRDLLSPVYVDMVSLLGKRAGELHLALASSAHDSDMEPDPFSMLYQKSVYQSMRALTLKVFDDLQSNVRNMDDEVAKQTRSILEAKQEILSRFRNITNHKISAMKIRIHGDYHLGQVLYTGKDFVIIDFEGEPARPLGERRLKRSVLRDVAGMIRSFHYAAHGVIILRPGTQTADLEDLQRWADLWYYCIAGVFLSSYLAVVGDAEFLPKDKQDFETLLEAFLLEKAVYELGYELQNRPDWLLIPIRGLQQTLKGKL